MPADTSPTARAIRTLELIQNRPGISAELLSIRLGVSERAARRYVATLREAGIPVESARGPYGGYRLGRGVRLPPMVFTAEEALGLVMAVLDGHHDAADPTDPGASALGKLLRALPRSLAATAEVVRTTTATAPDRAAARPNPAVTVAVVGAAAEQRRIRIGYRTESGRQSELEVDPWAVVVRHGRWYLLCWCHRAAGRRAYRIDRIIDVAVVDVTFEPPPELDPVVELEQHLASGWEYRVVTHIDAGEAEVRHWVPPRLGRLEPLDDSSCLLSGSTSNPGWYAEQLAAVPVPFRIVEGSEVRQALAELASRLTAAAAGVEPIEPQTPGS